MRIISGIYRGMTIFMPKGEVIRPTQDRVREALFNILRDTVIDATVLDLYAGSGAFGIEAISRGAKKAIFIDNDRRCITTIKKNLQKVKCEQEADVMQAYAFHGLKMLNQRGEKFEIVFMDPPYHKGIAKNCLLKLDEYDILSPNSYIIIEHHKKDTLPKSTERLMLLRQERYGDTILSFYKETGRA